MSFPGSATSLVPVIQYSDGSQPAETYTIATLASGNSPDGDYIYRLGSRAAVALPAGRQRIPKGALALPAPSAPTFVSELTSGAGYGLVPGQAYSYAMTTLTGAGRETTPSLLFTRTMGASGIGNVLQLPAATTNLENPAQSRRLYRSKQGTTSPLYLLGDVDGIAAVQVADGAPDGSLLIQAPASNSSGLASSVAVTGGSYGTLTEVVSAPGAGQYAVDYSQGPTGGLVTFAAADAGTTVTVTYTAGDNVNKALINNIIQAVKDIGNAAAHAGPTTTYLAAHGTALSGVGLYTTVPGESYSFTTLQPGSRVQVSVSIPIGMNTMSGDVKFILAMTAVPAGSSVPLAGIDPQWGTIKFGISHAVATVTTTFNADKAGTYTLAIQYVTTVGASGTFLYNEACNFGGVTTYQGTIEFVELAS